MGDYPVLFGPAQKNHKGAWKDGRRVRVRKSSEDRSRGWSDALGTRRLASLGKRVTSRSWGRQQILPWKLWKEHDPGDTLISDF